MKRRSAISCLVAFVLVFAVGFVVPDQTFAASDTKKPKATNVQYYTEKNKKTGIKTFTIDPYTYYNMSRNPALNPAPAGGTDPSPTMKLDDAALLRIARNQIFPRWGVVAEGIFRDQADQLVTIEGSGMMSKGDSSKKTDFDRHFSTGKVSNGYTDKWAVKDLAEYLSSTKSLHNGDRCWDETRVTGVTKIGSLSDARDLMGQELRNCSDDNDISKDEFLGNNHQKNEEKRRLPDLEDDKTGDGYASVVTCVNRAGASGDYDYVTFGLAVYDFDITPVAAQNLKYIEAADQDFEDGEGTVSGAKILMGNAGDNVSKAGISFQNDTTEGATSYLRNNTTQEVTQSSSLENSSTEESTLSTDDTYEWGMEQEIGTEWSFGGWGDEDCMFPRCTVNFSNTWHELWSTTKSKSETKSASKTKSVNTELTLPGHTVAVVNQSLNNKKTTENYQQPVILNYKVAVFAMSGDYFNGAAGGIENNRYDKQWMSVIFDGSDDYQNSGCNALGSLYNRGVVNRDTQGYDGAKGKYKVWCDKAAWNKSSKINWKSVSEAIEADNRSSHRIVLGTGRKATTINDLATELPLMEKAQMLTSRRESITSSVDQIVPLYPLDSVSMKNGSKNYEVRKHSDTDEKLHLDEIELEGFDSEGAEFYEFDPSWGEWKLLFNDDDDEDDEVVIEDNGLKDEDDKDGRIKSGGITLVTDPRTKSQWVETDNRDEDAVETHYLRWKLNDDAKIVSNENLTSEDHPQMTQQEKEDVDTPTVKVTVRDDSVEVKNIEAEGSYKMPLGSEEINLAHVFKADAVDESDKVRKVAMFWEAKSLPGSGIEVEENGNTVVSKKGTYKVRPYCYNSNGIKIYPKDENGVPVWLDLVVQDKAELSAIEMSKPEFDADEVTLTKKKPAQSYALDSFVKFYDQYGEKWEETKTRPLPKLEFAVDDNDGAEIDKENVLTVTRPGTYTISAKAYDVRKNAAGEEVKEDTGISIKPMKITIDEEDWLDMIFFNEPALDRNELKLKSSSDVVKVNDLKGLLTYVDQNNDEWTGKKPNVTFLVDGDPSGAEIKGGSFYAYEPGTYTIKASAEGFTINSIQIVVEEEQSLVLTAKDPKKQYLYSEDDSVNVELDRCINATTKFGGKWKGDVPELVYTLDPEVKNAKITKKTVYEDEDDYTGTDVYEFTSSVPGEYVVHVKPKKASEYTDAIDDLYINVVKGKKVFSMEFKDFNKEISMEELAVNHYNGYYPQIDLKRYLVFYDGYGEKIDPEKDHIKIPDCQFSIDYGEPDEAEDQEDEEYPDFAEIKDGVFKAYEPDNYIIKAKMTLNSSSKESADEEDVVVETVRDILVVDIDWLHDFGEWETVSEPSCGEEGLRVRECKGHDKDGDRQIDEECDYTITDIIPATGHRWKSTYDKLDKKDSKFRYVAVKCEECGAINEDTVTPYSIYYSNFIDPVYEEGHEATCTQSGVLIFKMKPSSGVGYVDKKVTVPPTGHCWKKDFSTVEGEEADCAKEGREAIKCERCGEIREGDEYSRVIPKEKHELDDDGWEYFEYEGDLFKESCDKAGVKSQECKKCKEMQLKLVLPTGHDWNEGEVTTAPTCMQQGVKTYTCKNDNNHTKVEYLPAKGHDWGAWTVSKQPTAAEKGIEKRVCKNDPAHVQTREIDNKAQREAAAQKKKADEEAAKKKAAAQKAAAQKAAAARAAAARAAQAKAKKVKKVTINDKTLNAAALGKAVNKAGGSNKYVTTIIVGNKVKKIAPETFKNYAKVKTLLVRTKKLKKSSVKKALKGSKITKIKIKAGSGKVNKKYVKKYKVFFDKKNSGKKVKVVR